jgi:hypothetical protein
MTFFLLVLDLNKSIFKTRIITLQLQYILKYLGKTLLQIIIIQFSSLFFQQQHFMFKLMIDLLKFVKKRDKSTKDAQSIKQREISWTISNLMEKVMSSPLTLFFLNFSPFNVFNFNFDYKIIFLILYFLSLR